MKEKRDTDPGLAHMLLTTSSQVSLETIHSMRLVLFFCFFVFCYISGRGEDWSPDVDAFKSLRPTAWCVSRTDKVLPRSTGTLEGRRVSPLCNVPAQSVPAASPSLTAHRASSVGELSESDEGSLLLLPFRWAAAQLGKESASG